MRWLFKIERTQRAGLWELEDDLPLSWGLISREIWAAEKEQAINQICEAMREVMEGNHRKMAEEYVGTILNEGRSRMETNTDADARQPEDSSNRAKY